jgi:hypothetical protein
MLLGPVVSSSQSSAVRSTAQPRSIRVYLLYVLEFTASYSVLCTTAASAAAASQIGPVLGGFLAEGEQQHSSQRVKQVTAAVVIANDHL